MYLGKTECINYYDIHEVFYRSFGIHDPFFFLTITVVGDTLHKAMHSYYVHNVLMLNCDIHGHLSMGQK